MRRVAWTMGFLLGAFGLWRTAWAVNVVIKALSFRRARFRSHAAFMAGLTAGLNARGSYHEVIKGGAR